MRHLTLFFLAILLFNTRSTAQVKSLIGPSKIYYKDGSIFKGEILMLDQDHITFLISSDTVTLFHDKIKKFVSLNDRIENGQGNSGYFINASTGISPFEYTLGAEIILAKRLSKRFAIGASGGYYIYRENNDNRDQLSWPPPQNYKAFLEQDFVNLSGYARYTLGANKIKWFVDGKAGYGIKGPKESPTYDRTTYHRKGGVAFQPGVGATIPLQNNFKMSVSVNHLLQFTRTEKDLYTLWGRDKYSFWFSRTLLKIGLEFG